MKTLLLIGSACMALACAGAPQAQADVVKIVPRHHHHVTVIHRDRGWHRERYGWHHPRGRVVIER